MTHLQMTPERPPAETVQPPAAESTPREGVAGGDIPASTPDQLRRAQARRLEMMELERASDEGMPTPQRTRPRSDERGG